MQDIEKTDIQGLLIRGYAKLPAARFLLLEITDPAFAKNYLNDILSSVVTVDSSPDDLAINIAFSANGLKALGLPDNSLKTYSREFLEGMDDPYRSFLLGDQGQSNPANWNWGGPKNPQVHILLMVYAKDDSTLENTCTTQMNNENFKKGLSLTTVKYTNPPPEKKEHFGFRDGITQPDVEGLIPLTKIINPKITPIKTGEFVLGYKNEYNTYNESPTTLTSSDPNDILPPDKNNPALKDLGKNGTYLVYREIEQDPVKFWEYLTANAQGANKIEAAIKLGAKFVGRWPNGVPLVLSPAKQTDDIPVTSDFNYFNEDPSGQKCPVGAHIRRSNPRDQLFGKNQDTAIEMTRKHHLLRRGRSFGKPLADSMNPEDILKATNDPKEKRGLHFICLNASISRQFEFIQSLWITSSKFGGLYNDPDPILGGRENTSNEFTCPMDTLSAKYKNIPSFTTVAGGGYFFLPGIKALRYLSAQLRGY